MVVVRTGAAGAATGFVAGDDRVVTVAHVLDGTGLAVRSPGGGWTTATALCRDRDADLALLAAPGTSGAPLRVAPAEQGAPVLLPVVRGTAAAGGPGAAGGPAAVRGELRRRITAHVATGLGGASRRTLLELGVNARVGDFGAPVVTADGAVAGVLFARSVGRAGIAYAEDGAALRRLLAAGRCAPPR
ncbi:trypsin-like peptidase domain-containing protein [Conexibacter arvalis]|uniref:Serine protease n=1 Tax=Conexibacter arvalis TaxID=912552 RepID=A0A840I806_9ACTN|nr:hypothetical protein [Conexibacter arvalis]